MYDEEVSAYEQDIEFVIGSAGMGKSTLLAERANKHSLVLTPTHKAKQVLIDKGLENVVTIHSLLKLVPTINQEFRTRGNIQKLKQIGDINLVHIDTIIIDEFSMIPTFIMDKLLEALPSRCKVIVYGDASQLPPVDGQPIDPLDYTSKITKLTKQYRAEAPEVVDTFMRFAKYIETGDHHIDLRMHPDIKYGSLASFNHDTDKIIAFTNKRVIELNTIVADDAPIAIGDEMTANTLTGVIANSDDAPMIFPKCLSKGNLADDWEDKADTALRDISKYGTDLSMYDIVSLEINEEIYSMYVDLDHYKNNNELKSEVEEIQLEMIRIHDLDKDINLGKWCRENRGKKLVRDRGRAWSRYLAHSNLVFDFRRPYATTVHRVQGQEFDKVFIDIANMQKAIRGGDYMQYSRLMYVALSRAKKEVILL